jgi:hypothetical protein
MAPPIGKPIKVRGSRLIQALAQSRKRFTVENRNRKPPPPLSGPHQTLSDTTTAETDTRYQKERVWPVDLWNSSSA